jgi:hypothetical protein
MHTYLLCDMGIWQRMSTAILAVTGMAQPRTSIPTGLKGPADTVQKMTALDERKSTVAEKILQAVTAVIPNSRERQWSVIPERK